MSVVENIQNVRAKIAAAAEKSGRTAEDVLLLAVSKTKPVELIGEAVQAGCLSLGENNRIVWLQPRCAACLQMAYS